MRIKPGTMIKVVCIKDFILPQKKIYVNFLIFFLLSLETEMFVKMSWNDDNLKMIKLQDELFSVGLWEKNMDVFESSTKMKLQRKKSKKIHKFTRGFLWKFPTVKAKSIVMHCWHLSRKFLLKELSSFDEV